MFDFYFLNKTIGALLFSILVLLGVGIVSNAIFEVSPPETPGYEIAVADAEQAGEDATQEAAGEAAPGETATAGEAATAGETAASGGETISGGEAASGEAAAPDQTAAASEGGQPAAAAGGSGLGALLAGADADDGKKVARKCAACHTFDEGGANRVGPNLHGIVGRPVASHEGFAYSAAMKQKGGTWGYAELDAFVHAPKDFVPGTSMTFAGVRKDEDRADLLMYLRSVSPDAPPLPQ